MRSWRAGIFVTGMLAILSVLIGCEVVSVFNLGDTVPDFAMPDQHGQMRTLSEELAQPGINGAILAFYILDNSPG